MKHEIIFLIILALGFTVRLYKITNPVADWHSWRQADTASVTRNFVKYGVDLLHPRFDDFSDTSGKGLFNPNGYRFVEFPIFNLIHYSLFIILSFSHLSLETIGRLTSVLAALTSSVLIYLILSRKSGKTAGLLGMGFFLFLPYNIFFTRIILPESLMVTLSLAALVLFDYKKIYLSAIFGALAVLVKPVALFLLMPIFWQWWREYKLQLFKSKLFWIWNLILFTPFLMWRIWEARYPMGVPANIWLLNGNGIRFKGAFFQWIFGERIGHLILGSWGIYPLLEGLVAINSYWLAWVIGALAYLTVFATGNVHHDYYQITIIPIISIILALGVSRANTFIKKLLMLVCVLFMFAFSWYEVRGRYQINHYSIVDAGRAVDRLTPKDAVVLAPYNGDTAFLYQTNRRGFPFVYFPVKDFIDNYGVTYYVSVNYDALTREVMNKYTVVEQNPDFVIVKLEELQRL